MKNNLKRLLAAALIITNIGTFNISSLAESEVKTTYTLDEATELAMKYNTGLLLSDIQSEELSNTLSLIRRGEKSLEDSKNILQAAGQGVSGMNSYESFKVSSGYQADVIKSNKDLMEESSDIQEYTMKLVVKNAYNKVQINKKKSESAKRNYNLAVEQKNNSSIKLKAGIISEIQYKSIELEANGAEIAMIKADNDYKKSLIDFNEMIGIDINIDTKLTTEIKFEEKVIDKSEEKIALLKDKDLELKMAINNNANIKREEKLVRGYYGSGSTEYDNAKLASERSDLELKNQIIKTDKKIIITHMDLEILSKNLKLMEERVSLMKLMLGLTDIRQKAGMATESEVIKSSLNYIDAENEYLDLLNTYDMLIEMYNGNIMK